MIDKLKLITTDRASDDNENVLFIEDMEEYSEPYLSYNSGATHYVLDSGGSERVGLVKCSNLKEILDKYLFKGTKFIISPYDPTLCYLIPGIHENDELFTSDNNFIPTLPIDKIARQEVNGFKKNFVVSQDDIRSIKACDSWLNDLDVYEELAEKIDNAVNNLYSYYKDPNILKVESEKTGSYSVDLSKNSFVVSLISDTTYTDTINLEDWILQSKKGNYGISGKLDISYMYSKGGEMFGGMQTIKAFQYEENIISNDIIINLSPVQIEYMNNILKIYPLEGEVDEVVFTDCTLTIGCL